MRVCVRVLVAGGCAVQAGASQGDSDHSERSAAGHGTGAGSPPLAPPVQSDAVAQRD